LAAGVLAIVGKAVFSKAMALVGLASSAVREGVCLGAEVKRGVVIPFNKSGELSNSDAPLFFVLRT
jgi:hypothetical protein